MAIRHRRVTGAASNPDVLVDGPAWDEDHTGLENVPNVDATNASNISSGTLPADRLPVVGTVYREILMAARTYFVKSTGSDSNTGLVNSAGGAFLTPQKAFNVIANNLDLNGQAVTVDLTGSAFTSGVVFPNMVGNGTVTLTSSTAGASITTTSSNAIVVSGNAELTITGANITLATVTSGICLIAYAGGKITYGGITFGASATGHIQAGWIASGSGGALRPAGGTVYASGNYTITGGAGFHYHSVTEGSLILGASGITVTLTGTPAFSNWFAAATKGLISLNGVTFSGAATGQRYLLHNHSLLFGLTSRTALPGNAAGSVASAGVYTADLSDTDSDIGVSNIVGTNRAALGTPAAGLMNGWFDSTDKRFHDKNDAGTIGTTVVADTGAAGQFISAISAAGVITKTTPAIGMLYATITGVNFNSANSDNAIPISLPTGFTRFVPFRLVIDHASQTLTTSTFGLFSATAGGGFAIQAGGTANTVSTASDATANNCQTISLAQTTSFVAASLAAPNTVYFRVGTAQGAAATGDVTFSYFPLP